MMKLYHVTTKKGARELVKDQKANKYPLYAWGYLKEAEAWARMNPPDKREIVIIEVKGARRYVDLYWLIEEGTILKITRKK